MLNTKNLPNIITEEHEEKWVAIARDYSEVVDFDESLVALNKKIRGRDVVYMKVPPSDVYLSF